MTVPEGVLARITGVLDKLGIPYMACGSLSCMAYGEPRMSNDVDIVIAPSRSQLEELTATLDKDFYVSRSAAIEAFEQKSMFNVIDKNESFKVDLIILKDRAYDTERFSRRRKRKVVDVELWLLSAEDSIRSKLDWCKGKGVRQSTDARCGGDSGCSERAA